MKTDKSAKKLVKKIKSLHIQSHAYPSRREIITKCEAGSFHPILTTKGMGRSIGDKKASDKAFSEGLVRIFGRKKLNVMSAELRAEFEADRKKPGNANFTVLIILAAMAVGWIVSAMALCSNPSTCETGDPNKIVSDANYPLLVTPYPVPPIRDMWNLSWPDFEAEIIYDPNNNTITLTGFTIEEALKRFFYHQSRFYDPNEYLMSAEIIAPSKYCTCTGSQLITSCLVYGCDGKNCTRCNECGKLIDL